MRFCVSCSMLCCCNHLDGEDRAGCFTLIAFLVSCDCYYPVALPHGAAGRPTLCDCGIPEHTHLLFCPVICRALCVVLFL